MNNLFKICLICLVCFYACKKEETPEPTIYKIDPAVSIYMDRFVQEAKNRGVVIKLENLIVELNATTAQASCANCILEINNPNKQRKVTINTGENFCWKDQTDLTKEALIFHELGHCLLGRIEHKEDFLPNGSPASIMYSLNNAPYSICLYQIDNEVCDKRSRRNYYLDELFDPKVPTPTWGKK